MGRDRHGARPHLWPHALSSGRTRRALRHSCELGCIPQPLADDEVRRTAEQLVAHNAADLPESEELVLILFATPGECGTPTFGIHTTPFDAAVYRQVLLRGAKLVTPAVRHIPAECLPAMIKMRSRLFWWRAEQQARELDPEASALLLDLAGHVTETAAANFLLVREGMVISPPGSTILDGISRRMVAGLCGEIGLPFVEQPIDLQTCYSADEALLTSTPYGLAGVAALNGRPLRWPGPVLGRLHDAWCAQLGQEIWRPMLPGR